MQPFAARIYFKLIRVIALVLTALLFNIPSVYQGKLTIIVGILCALVLLWSTIVDWSITECAPLVYLILTTLSMTGIITCLRYSTGYYSMNNDYLGYAYSGIFTVSIWVFALTEALHLVFEYLSEED